MKHDKTILLVEDQTIIALATAQAIQQFGYEVFIVNNGREAIVKATQDAAVDLVLIDIDLGSGIDGTQTARKILLQRSLPIVFLTAHGEREMVERVKGISRYGYVIKNSGSFLLQSSLEMAFELYDAYQKVSQSEARWQYALESAGDGVWDWNMHSSEMFCSPRLKEMLGYEQNTVFPDGFSEIMKRIHPKDQGQFIYGLNQYLIGSYQNFEVEFRVLSPDASCRWMLARGKVIEYFEDGRPARMIGTFSDIHERKQTEEALRKSEEQYRTLFENLPIPVFTKDRDGIYTSSNAENLKYLGISPIGHTDQAIFPPEVAEKLREADLQVIKTGTTLTFEEHLPTPAGERYYLSRKVPLRDKNENLVGVLGASLDITKKKETTNVMQSRLYLHEFAATHSLEELLQATLDEAEKLTGSQTGFYHFLEADQCTLALQVWSESTLREHCQAKGHGLHYDVSKAGVWVDCIYQRKPVIHNDYAALPHRKGLPEGHAPVIRELVVPVFRGDRIVSILGVGNKPTDYEDQDINIVSLLADLAWDIAENKRKDQELRQSEERFRTMFERHHAVMLLIDPDSGQIVNANQAAVEFYGYAHDVLCQMKIEQINCLSPEQVYAARQQAKLMQSNFFSFPHRLANQEIRIVDVHASPMELDGRTMLFSIIQDVTERVKVEADLRKVSQAVEQSSSSIVITNLEGNIEYANPWFSKITGYSLEEVLGKNPRVLKSGKTEPETYAQLWQTITSGKQWHGEFINQKKNGEFFWESASIAPVTDGQGRITHFVAVKEDITERRQTVEAIRIQRDLGTALSAINDLPAACDQVIASACTIHGVDCGGIYQVEEESGRLVLVAHRGLSQPFVDSVYKFEPESLHAQIVRSGIPGYGLYGRVELTMDPARESEGLRAFGFIPVKHEGKVIACLNLASRTQDDFPMHVRTIVEGIAVQIGGTLARIQAEGRMRASEERYQAFIAQSFEGIYRTEFFQPIDCSLPVETQVDLIYANAYIAECNQALADMFHLPSSDSFTGKRLIDLHGGKHNPINRASISKFVANGYKSINEETFEYGEDGQPIWFLSNTVGTIENGHLMRMWGTALVITKRKMAEEALRKSERKFRSFVEQNSEGFLLVDEQGLIIEWNQALSRILDLPAEDTIGRQVWDVETQLLPGQSMEAQHESRKSRTIEILRTGTSPLFDAPVTALLHQKNGREIAIQQIIFPIRTDQGYQIGSVMRDITEARRLEQETILLNQELLTAYHATIEGWASTLELRNQETVGHSRRVVDLTISIAQAVGIPEDDMENIRRGAVLHDIGKMGIPDAILLKPGPLTDPEWELMRQHPSHALQLLSRIPFLKSALDIPYCHHEHWDGSGYPRGLKGEEIPLAARIFTIVDVWDALTSNRPYRTAWTNDDALRYIASQAGIQFDPDLVQAFLRLHEERWDNLP